MASSRLKKLLETISLLEKKEALVQAPTLNLTLHFDDDFLSVGGEGKPEVTITVSTSSVGGKNLMRTVASEEDALKVTQGVKSDLRRITRKYDAALEKIYKKHGLRTE